MTLPLQTAVICPFEYGICHLSKGTFSEQQIFVVTNAGNDLEVGNKFLWVCRRNVMQGVEIFAKRLCSGKNVCIDFEENQLY